MSKSQLKTIGPNKQSYQSAAQARDCHMFALPLRAGIDRTLKVRRRSKVVLRIPGVEIGIFEADVDADVPIRILGNKGRSGSLSQRKSVLLDSNRQIRFLIDIQSREMIRKLLARTRMRRFDDHAFQFTKHGVGIIQFGVGIILRVDFAVLGFAFPLLNDLLQHVVQPDFCDRITAFRQRFFARRSERDGSDDGFNSRLVRQQFPIVATLEIDHLAAFMRLEKSEINA